MKLLCSILISISVVWADESGLRYEKEKVCEQLHAMGLQKFKGLFVAVYSQKFPNSTLEEVTCVAEEMVKLGERCCAEGATQDCYDKGATEITAKSCQADSPFPKHPGISKCCAEADVHQRKVCLASLHYSAEELPSLLEPTNEEMCQDFTKDPIGYSSRYMYELARRHRSVPTGLVLNATFIQTRMLQKCCTPTVSQACFLDERFQEANFNILLRFTSNMCHNNVILKSYRDGLTAYVGSLLNIPFEKAQPMVKDFQAGLSKCCLQPNPDCLMQEFTHFQKAICDDASPSEELKKCCAMGSVDTLPCVESLKRTTRDPPASPPTPALCQKDSQEPIERFLFQTGARLVYSSLPVMTTALGKIKDIVEKCCSDSDVPACMAQEDGDVVKITGFLFKSEEICSKYMSLDFPAFKAMVKQEVAGEGGQAAVREEMLVELGSVCCSKHSPALRCQSLTEKLLS
ncbi:vitamin D-binding protein [Engraulis encrasicolus]|uniref:vitamin D-binding protein n=1 Tax=Engraulis encrasicolus TaxID=184585 RepID=UPI002FD17558